MLLLGCFFLREDCAKLGLLFFFVLGDSVGHSLLVLHDLLNKQVRSILWVIARCQHPMHASKVTWYLWQLDSLLF